MRQVTSLLLLFALVLATVYAQYEIGTGIYDITGPVAEIRFFGYASPSQTGKGLHLRLRSRAYHINEIATGETITIVVADLWAISSHIKTEVLRRLEEVFPGEFNSNNLILGCTHTHSGPGGYDEHFLFNVPAFGFCEENFEVVVSGLTESITRARSGRVSGKIFVNKGDIEKVQVNRSPPPYLNNPAEERAQYDSDVDKELMLLKFVADDGTELGALSYHGVHPVSMKIDNRLVSSDNKGFASYLFEQSKGTNYQEKVTFVASFGIANAGDVSPNTGGTLETGELIGEGKDYFESTLISATRQFEKAREVYDAATEQLVGGLTSRVMNVDMSNVYVEKYNVSTVSAALGYSFTAGTADGIAFGMEYQGMTEVIPLLEKVSKVLANYSDEFQEQHGKKPILIPAGLTRPGPMVPQILQVQLVKIGQYALIAFPSEITTMAGRRLKKTVLDSLSSVGVKYVTISALTNGYAQYVTTKEEYDIQWYEGASTYFGPYTLAAYQQQYETLARHIVQGTQAPAGPELPVHKPREVLPGHRFDSAPSGYDFGDVMTQPQSSYSPLQVVSVVFAGANPRSNPRLQDTFLLIEREVNGQWVAIANDASWETKFHWEQIERGVSIVTIDWEIPSTTPTGTYRIHYFGDAKNRVTGRVSPIEGVSNSFQVLSK